MTTGVLTSNLRGDMSDHQDEPRYVSSTDAARILGVSVKTVRRAAAAGKLPGLRIGGEWRFLVSDLGSLTKQSRPSSTE